MAKRPETSKKAGKCGGKADKEGREIAQKREWEKGGQEPSAGRVLAQLPPWTPVQHVMSVIADKS